MEEILKELKSAIKTELPYMSSGATLNIKNKEWNDALYFAIKKLESLKSHTDKVVIPNFVADLIECYKSQGNSLGELLAHIEYDDVLKIKLEMLSKVVEWVYPDDFSDSEDRTSLIARAWLDGYEVEKEKKYYVMNHKGATMLAKTPSGGIACSNCSDLTNVRDEYLERYQLTEKEIKSVDERYWAFAEPIDDIE